MSSQKQINIIEQLAQMQTQLAVQAAKLAQQEAEIASLRQQLTTNEPPLIPDPPPLTPNPSSRRRLLKQVAAGVAGLGALSIGAAINGAAIAQTGGDNTAIEAIAGTSGYGGRFGGGVAPLRLIPASSPNAPTSGSHLPGELYVDSTGALFYCTDAGTPGTWVKLSASTVSAPSITFLPSPIRVALVLPSDAGILTSDGSGSPASVFKTVPISAVADLTGSSAARVPTTAKAIVASLTSVGATSSGNLRLWPSGGVVPGTNTLNIPAKPDGTGFNLTTTVVVGLGSDGKISIGFSGGAGATCGFAIDVAGYLL